MTDTAYIITGPTASGKSDFAHAIARRVGGAADLSDGDDALHGPFKTSRSADRRKTDRAYGGDSILHDA